MLSRDTWAEWIEGWSCGALDIGCGNVPTAELAEKILWHMSMGRPGSELDAHDYGYSAALSAALGVI